MSETRAYETSACYAVIATLMVAALAFLTPPLLVSDEPNHFYRSYEISMGELRGVAQGGVAGGVLPQSLASFEEQVLRARVRDAGSPGAAFPLRQTWSESIALDPARTSFVGFTQMAIYAPFNYFPQALGIAIARWGGGDVLAVLIAGRLMNGLVAVALTAWALRVLPAAQPIGIALALLPMNLVQYASVSGDAMLISCGFLFAALVFRASRDGQWQRGGLVAASLCGIVVVAAKIVYAPLLLLGLWPAVMRWRRGDPRLLHAQAVLVLTGLAAAIGWLAAISDLMLPIRPDVIPTERLMSLLREPIGYAALLFHTFVQQAGPWLLQSVGVFRWSELHLPVPVYAVLTLGVGCGYLASGTAMNRAVAGWASLMVAACVVLISTALFLTWSTSADVIDGIQGRYFNPLLLAAGAALASLFRRGPVRLDRRIGLSFVCIGLAAFIRQIVVDYRLL